VADFFPAQVILGVSSAGRPERPRSSHLAGDQRTAAVAGSGWRHFTQGIVAAADGFAGELCEHLWRDLTPSEEPDFEVRSAPGFTRVFWIPR
jgi:hypothetical protein